MLASRAFARRLIGAVIVTASPSAIALAALVAASRENVNRALAPLVAGGVISQSNGHFVVHDLAALAASSESSL